MALDADGKFGAFLYGCGQIDEESLAQARAVQRDEPYLRVGEILVSQGKLDFGTLRQHLLQFRAQAKLGQLLVMEGAITRAQLQEALVCQADTGMLLGTILVEMGACADGVIQRALEIQRRHPPRADA